MTYLLAAPVRLHAALAGAGGCADQRRRQAPGAIPAWNKGMIAITAESYYPAIECGRQGGDDPACVFCDTGLCKDDDFTLTFYSGYKQVAYEVWNAVRKKKPAPQPSYQAAQRTRVTLEMVGKSRTVSCAISPEVLRQFR
jgi:hypothetical protein